MGLLRMILDWFGLIPDAEATAGTRGYGEFGGNGSLHWKTVTDRGVELEASDPFPVASVGTTKNLTPGHFRVRMRYPSLEAAEAARQSLPISERDGIVFLDVDVPALARESMKENPPAEIRVDW